MATEVGQSAYKQHTGVDYLSRNFESHFLHTPKYLDRITVSQDQFDSYLARTKRPDPPLPWGRSLGHGGFGHVEVPPTVGYEIAVTQHKGHSHYGGGALTYPRSLPIEQYYDLTLLKRSHVRRNDQLLPNPEQSEMGKLQIRLPFPSEHPYHSHMAKLALFPSFDTPDDVRKGILACQSQATLPETAPASAPDPTVMAKTKGNFARWEIVKPQNASERKPLSWPGHLYYQLVKGPEFKRQDFYPTPPTSVLPNVPHRPQDMTLSPRTANSLNNLQQSYSRTFYQDQYTGNGPLNVLKLDNYDDWFIGKGNQLQEHFCNKFMPPRPLEGRHTSIRNQKKRPVLDDKEKQEEESGENEDDEIENVLKKMPWHSFAHTSFHPSVEKLDDGVLKSYGPKALASDFENLKIGKRGNLVPLCNSDQSKNTINDKPTTFPTATILSRSLARPKTAPQRSVSPIVYNMPSQLHEPTMTGSTNNDLYPKWFRPGNQYERPVSRPSTFYMNLQNSWSKTETRRRFHEQFPENAPDIRHKPDLRITTNERRHVIPETGMHGYHLH